MHTACHVLCGSTRHDFQLSKGLTNTYPVWPRVDGTHHAQSRAKTIVLTSSVEQRHYNGDKVRLILQHTHILLTHCPPASKLTLDLVMAKRQISKCLVTGQLATIARTCTSERLSNHPMLTLQTTSSLNFLRDQWHGAN